MRRLFGIALAALGTGFTAMATEKPKYTVVARLGEIEVRDYPGLIVAETRVIGSREDAGNTAFRRLAGYIFGKNRSRSKIAMTAPVTQVAEGPSEKIAMTAPVLQTKAEADNSWWVQFTMPASYSMEALPEPLDPAVSLRQLPAKRVAAIHYKGSWSTSNYDQHWARLQAAVAKEKLEPMGEPLWARYDPPFVPWFLKDNEILLEVRRQEPLPSAP